MKSQVDMNQLNAQNLHRKKRKVGIGYTEEDESTNKELKRIKDLLAIIVVRQFIHKINVGAMGKENLMESATIAIKMVIRLMNGKRNQDLKEKVTSVTNMDITHQNEKPRY